jgi:glucokinase
MMQDTGYMGKHAEITELAGAVDIGGTKTTVGIVDKKGKIYVERTFPTRTGKGAATVSIRKMAAVLKEQVKLLELPDLVVIAGIGVVCTGPVDELAGTVENPYTLSGWEGYPVVRKLAGATGARILLENDLNGALMGEVFLHRIEEKEVLMVSFGTGIGVAAWNKGQIHRAGRRFHPEMGHTIVSSDGPECYCGHPGCFESLCSGKALNSRAVEAGFADFDKIYEASLKGDDSAARFIQKVSREIQNGIWNIMTVFKPDVLILGGGIMKRYFEFFSHSIKKDLERVPDFIEEFTLMKADMLGNSSLIGASRLVFGN